MLNQDQLRKSYDADGFVIIRGLYSSAEVEELNAQVDVGLRAAEQPQLVKNLHATILTALGLNPDDLFFEHAGRQERLTGVAQCWKTIPGVLS